MSKNDEARDEKIWRDAVYTEVVASRTRNMLGVLVLVEPMVPRG
jgi:hypothetical protein